MKQWLMSENGKKVILVDNLYIVNNFNGENHYNIVSDFKGETITIFSCQNLDEATKILVEMFNQFKHD